MQKNILITGCSSGIGLISALDLHQRGYRVIAGCRKADDLTRLDALGLTALLIDMDDPTSIDQAIERVKALTGGKLFALFNNAGYGQYGPLTTISRQQMERQFSTNFFGVHQLTLGLLPLLQANGHARILNTSSVMGFIATPGRGAYAASKYALEAWTDTLRMELSDLPIAVSLLEPGPITTAFSNNVQQGDHANPVENPGIAARFALPPEALLPKIRHALESRYPQRRYPVTLVTYAMAIAKRLLPSCLMDIILNNRTKKS
ncbi:SDR family oxidoreductase [Rosenbergiella nectarea]|uniref:SDR family oxidoreductase n=1 Tax=Rosenbergiella nectarea TaxID=988801 RepID=UPI001BDA5599|nr:SDR family oxidoreductase [Rosenbergiella nectarea subsp. apis]